MILNMIELAGMIGIMPGAPLAFETGSWVPSRSPGLVPTD
jgi:hypothetical protein